MTHDVPQFCKQLPKIELHCHLNGSCRESTVRALAARKGLGHLVQGVFSEDRTLAACFRIFDLIHQVTTDHESITRITREVVEDCEADKVIYLELRTTPKARLEYGISKRSYVEAVLAGMAAHASSQAGRPGILVRLLLSIDRRETAAAAMETVELAHQMQSRGIAGIDLSGNPMVGQWQTWEAALRHARDLGLRLTLHAGEVLNPAETRAMLALRPERLGHMCCLDDASEQEMLGSCIPVELCLSSNVITKSVPSYADHHFVQLYTAGHPVALCTDDSGVFVTSLSKEYAIAQTVFQLSNEDLFRLSVQTIEYSFVDEQQKAALRVQMDSFWQIHNTNVNTE